MERLHSPPHALFFSVLLTASIIHTAACLFSHPMCTVVFSLPSCSLPLRQKNFLHGNFGEYVQLLFSARLQLDRLHSAEEGEEEKKEELRSGLCTWMKRGGGGSGKEDAGVERIAEADDFLLLSRMTALLIIAENVLCSLGHSFTCLLC